MSAQRINAKITLVVGMGVTGLSCAQYLQQQGEMLRIVDSREHPPMLLDIKHQFKDCDVHAGVFTPELLTNVNRILLSPGVPLADPFIQLALQQGIEVIGDIELFAQNVTAPVIAITGSNGKSTVTTLLAEMLEGAGLKVAAGGNLGTPALDLLQQSKPDVFVLELSSFQLETTESLMPIASVVLNISEDHMDRYTSLAAYAESKARIYRQATCCVINRDDSIVRSMTQDTDTQHLYFTADEPTENEFGLRADNGLTWLCCGAIKLVSTDQLRLIGKHNLLNALAALALAKAFGVDLERTLTVLKNFEGLAHRSQWVAECDGVRWINDSKATNVGAAKAAIESIAGPVVLIAGGDGKDADFTPLRHSVAGKAHTTILFGKDALRLQETLQDVTDCQGVSDLEAAVKAANKFAQAGDTVLLAPACASLDMFSNYMQRGELFRRYVLEIVNT